MPRTHKTPCFSPSGFARVVWLCHLCQYTSSDRSANSISACPRCNHDVIDCYNRSRQGLDGYLTSTNSLNECLVAYIQYGWNCWACGWHNDWFRSTCRNVLEDVRSRTGRRKCGYNWHMGGCEWVASLPQSLLFGSVDVGSTLEERQVIGARRLRDYVRMNLN